MSSLATPAGIHLLETLMQAAGWQSSPRRLAEATPHLVNKLAPEDLLKILRNLGVPFSRSPACMTEIKEADCPALFVGPDKSVLAVLGCRSDSLLIVEPGSESQKWQKPEMCRGELIRPEPFAALGQEQTAESFRDITAGFRGLIPWLLAASLMTNTIGLATPFLIILIYDRVIPADSEELISTLVFAVALILLTEAGFRYARSAAIAYMGRIVEHRLGLSLFRKLMALPLDQIRKSGVEQQLSRFRQFESLRDVFSGQVFTSLLDTPFVLIYLAALFFIASDIAFLICGLIAIFMLAIAVTLPVQQSLNSRTAQVRARSQEFLFETVSNQRGLARLGLETVWQDRYRTISQEAAEASRRSRHFQMLSQAAGQSLMMIAGLGAVVLGTLSSMSGEMSFGVLIAVMAIVWKVLTPLQALYANAPQIAGFLRSKDQVDRVLALPEEAIRGAGATHQKQFSGSISLSGVTHRFPGATRAVLSQISLDVAAGEFVVIAGGNGSGKTTLLDLMVGLHLPSFGSVHIDGIDLRQIPVDDLRQSFSYLGKKNDLFYGTLLQNFRLHEPTSGEEEVCEAIAAIDLKDEIDRMPDGLQTRLSESARRHLSRSSVRALGIAASFLRKSAVLALNEPEQGLDTARKEALLRRLGKLKGQKTIIVVTNDPSFVEYADRCLFLSGGKVVCNRTGVQGRKKLRSFLAEKPGQEA